MIKVVCIDFSKVTFLGSTPPCPDPSSKRGVGTGAIKRGSSTEKKEDERELLYELVMDICRDLDVTSLCHKILQNVSVLLNADRCSLFLCQVSLSISK